MAITVEDLGTNLITLEARFTGLEERYTRIETGLTQLLNKSSDLAHDIELRVEKEIGDKLDPIKEGLSNDRIKIKSLEDSKRYNFATIAAAGGFMFAIFTWYTTQQADAAKASIEAHTGAVRNEISSKDANIRTQLASDIAQNQAEISGLKALVDRRATQDSDYQSFKALVTAQNATSIIEQTDKGKLIGDMQTGLSGLTKDVAAITARADQKFASIETQFYAYGQMRNIQFSDQQRINAMHQNSLHDLGAKLPEYPVGPFYQPNISNPAGF